MSNKEKLSIAGSGIMGHSIALTAAWAGIDVKVWGTDEEDIKRAKSGVETKLNGLVSYDVFDEKEKERITNAITYTDSLEECVYNATFVIEAVPEDLELKQNFFKQLDEMCPEDTILASNTSGLSATEIATLTSKPERTVITHFWLPAHLMPLVEVVRGNYTSDETIDRALTLLESMNKKPVFVKKDVLGQVGNRLQYAIFREAQYLLENDIASMEDIDAAIQYSLGRRFGVTGPFMTMDMGGLNTNASITSYLFEDLSDRKEIFPAMKELVDNGHYGPKTGKGYYEWTTEYINQKEYEREEELIKWLKKDMNEANAVKK
ncbi:3-hydroxyacyl-CoA dehydrogenase family protein [Oceanobacillus timonensis]|uniref:3-hydroxyacyl-CoA dehydrogenase family protein n=1 Tax=Oceanobacillus timonensis TaxID=1926285 RepID=UPI0009BB84F6|nr:3-hydroxyacyl-CoA dehydrogenase family protein [Oceanobacillus timonensis]